MNHRTKKTSRNQKPLSWYALVSFLVFQIPTCAKIESQDQEDHNNSSAAPTTPTFLMVCPSVCAQQFPDGTPQDTENYFSWTGSLVVCFFFFVQPVTISPTVNRRLRELRLIRNPLQSTVIANLHGYISNPLHLNTRSSISDGDAFQILSPNICNVQVCGENVQVVLFCK